MGNDAVHAHVVPHMAVATRTLGGRVAPVCGVVAVASARLNAEQPLVPGQPLIPQGVPGGGVEVVMGVLGHQIHCYPSNRSCAPILFRDCSVLFSHHRTFYIITGPSVKVLFFCCTGRVAVLP